MLYCGDCETIFAPEPLEIHWERNGLDRMTCPNCNNISLIEIPDCKFCGKPIVPGEECIDDDEIHKECAADTEKDWQDIKKQTLHKHFSIAQIEYLEEVGLA